MNTDEKVIDILKNSIIKAQKIQMKQESGKNIEKIFQILTDFIKKNNYICYGGTAINNILPKKAQFYDYDTELPDYDFFSPNALDAAKNLADIYFKNGFISVEAKAGVHEGTFKVYVNYMAIADITFVPMRIFNQLKKDAITKKGIKYAPPNYLRMAAYLELSRPMGDVSRWEKVYKRLNLLNEYYPIKANNCKPNRLINKTKNTEDNQIIFNTIKDILIKEKCVFFGGFAINKFFELDDLLDNSNNKLPYFDVLCENSNKVGFKILDTLNDLSITKNIKLIHHDNIGEILSEHYELIVNNHSILVLYQPLACHSYNEIKINKKTIKIASIETIFSLYLAFLYVNSSLYNTHNILCICKLLFDIIDKNPTKSKGILKRFPVACYGKQHGLAFSRALKDRIKMTVKNKCSEKYQTFHLNYKPFKPDKCNKNRFTKKVKTKN